MTLQNKEIYKQKYLMSKLGVQGIKKELHICNSFLAPPAGLEPATL